MRRVFSGWPIPSFAGILQPQPATPAVASEAQHSFRDVRGAREERKHQRRKVGERKQHLASKLQSGPIAADMQSKAKGRMKAFSKAALTVMAAGSEPLAQAILQSREKTSDSSGIPPLYPQDADKWTVEQLRSQCPVAIHNQGWDGYRMADMLQSRYQRHTASGIVYHLQKFPSSIVAKFALNYKKPGQKPSSRTHSGRYEIITNGTCHPDQNLSAWPMYTQSCEKPGWPDHLQCCPYIRAIPALVDILSREPTAPRKLANTAAIHIRAGEVIDLSPCSVDSMMARYTRFARQCNPRDKYKVWSGTACMAVQAFEYVMPQSHFEWVRDQLRAKQITRVILVAGSALNLTAGFAKSCDYLSRVSRFFMDAGFEVSFRLGRPPDDDVRFFSRVAAFAPAGGSYSRIAAKAAETFGVQLIVANRSIPTPIRMVPHTKIGKHVKYIC